MKTTMIYRNYTGSVEHDEHFDLYFGQVLHISSLVNFEAKSEELLNLAFCEAVDSYLLDCKKRKIEPELPSYK